MTITLSAVQLLVALITLVGVGFTINMTQAPAAPCEFSYVIVRRT